MINSYGKNGKPFIINLLKTAIQKGIAKERLTFPFIVGAYAYLDHNRLTNQEYVKMTYDDIINITDYELIFDSCEELQTQTIGLKSNYDNNYIKAARFLPIAPNSSVLYNAEIFGASLTADDLYNRNKDAFNENKYSRNKESLNWEMFNELEREVIITSSKL